VNSLNWEGKVAPTGGILPSIYHCSAQELNYGYSTLIMVFSFEIVLGMDNKAREGWLK
jgi:hypothetical protein